MEVDGNVDAERVTEQEARIELDRLLSDPQFHLTERPMKAGSDAAVVSLLRPRLVE